MRSAFLVTTLLFLVACDSSGQPGTVTARFYDAAMRGDVATARRCLAERHGEQTAEILAAATRERTLSSVELVKVDVWSEGGAFCEVRKAFPGGVADTVRVDLEREGGDWKLVSGTPGF